jgi:hypothetical protein
MPMRISGKRSSKALAVLLLAFAVSGGVAQAVTVSTTGAKAGNNVLILKAEDTKADGYNAYANWNNTGGNRVETSGGYGSTNSVKTQSLTSFRACRDVKNDVDNCSSWVIP